MINDSLESLKNSNVYSSDEQLIGTWFNKPMYRKCYIVQNVKINGEQIEHGISNLERIIKIDGVFFTDEYSQCHKLGVDSQDPVNKNVYGCSIGYLPPTNVLKTYGYWGSSTTSAIIEEIAFELLYTKTADV